MCKSTILSCSVFLYRAYVIFVFTAQPRLLCNEHSGAMFPAVSAVQPCFPGACRCWREDLSGTDHSAGFHCVSHAHR